VNNQMIESIVTILTAIVGVAILALLVSKKSNTSGVIQSAASGFSNALATAVSPVTGNNIQTNLGYPATGFGAF
jgi:hypothetical protein